MLFNRQNNRADRSRDRFRFGDRFRDPDRIRDRKTIEVTR